jgi:hypothetical protein
MKCKGRLWLSAFFPTWMVFGTFFLGLFLVPHTTGQTAGQVPIPMTTDWTHRHVVFSAPSSRAHEGRLQSDYRFLQQWVRRMDAVALEQAREFWRDRHRDDTDRGHHRRPPRRSELHRDWSMSLGVGGSVGDEMFPAKFSFDVTAAPDCVNDFVVFNTSLVGVTGVPGTPSVVAYNHLYSTQGGNCLNDAANGSGPQVFFAYNTNIGTAGTGTTSGKVTTSAVLALDGSKVAYVESGAASGAILRILKWDQDAEAGVGSPDQVLAAGSSWTACNLPSPNSCLIGIPFSGNPQDSGSSPFYDYSTDSLYVGDNSGNLHKFLNVFGAFGTPSEQVTGGWPITLGTSGLTSPVYDAGSHNIFVGDSSGHLHYVKESGSTTGVCSSSSNGGVPPCRGTTDGTAGGQTSISLGGDIDDAPLVDGTTGKVFFFNGNAGTISNATIPNNSSCAGGNTNDVIVQTDLALTVSTGIAVCLGNGGTPGVVTNMKSGAFDNAYFSSAPPNQTGHLYFCARNTTDSDLPSLFRISFDSTGKMNSAPDGTAGSNYLAFTDSNGAECSPITEIFNPNQGASGTDWLFVSVGNHAIRGGCNGTGCLMSFNLTALGSTWPPTAASAGYAVPSTGGTAGNAGTSGIIVDNVANPATYPQASSIYFSTLANGTCNGTIGVGCAVKLTQSGLQ